MANITIEQRIRSFLNPTLRGKFINAFIAALAAGDSINNANILAVRNNLFLASAEGQFLDKIAAGFGIIRPSNVGMGDDEFRNMVASIHSNKVVSNLYLKILNVFFGDDATKSNVIALQSEPYDLSKFNNIIILPDDGKGPLEIKFTPDQFTNISQATAIEVASVISNAAVSSSRSFSAESYFDVNTATNYVKLFSNTLGPQSHISVIGGLANNVFQFPLLKTTSQQIGTQISRSIVGSVIRYTWVGGNNPSFNYVSIGDYVNIASSPFLDTESGSFTVTNVVDGPVGFSYFDIVNPLVQEADLVAPIVTLASSKDIMFFNPKKFTLNDLSRFATVYEVNPYEIVIYLPATAKIVRRELLGAWHAHIDGANKDYISAYSFNPKGGYSITGTSVVLNKTIEAGQVYTISNVFGDSSAFPDEQGYITFEFGTANEEGPIKYLGRPSNDTILLDPAYVFKKTHLNPEITLVNRVSPYTPSIDGFDYPTYATGTVAGRIAAEELSREIAASGIFVNVIIVYPNGPGLNNVEDVYAGDL